jgi:carbamoyl-phosphate synthase small subunit
MMTRAPDREPLLHATLMLADGTVFAGGGLGRETTTTGELVFSTSMTGYQEALTDPSYRGQILMFTYPLIGNYGILPGRSQSSGPQPRAAIVATLSESWKERKSLREFLREHQVPVMYGVDTRAIAQWVRIHGAMPAVLAVHDAATQPEIETLRREVSCCDYETTDFVAETSVLVPEVHGAGARTIALLDCGNKVSVTQRLVAGGSRVIVLPAHTTAPAIMSMRPDGVVISNGPGNPDSAARIVSTVSGLFGHVPLFGICLGHQLVALAAGCRTYKLKFGHRGANHPVQDVTSGRAFITTQNHGYAVDAQSLPSDLLVSHRNLNDGTVEGLKHRYLPIRSVQFHPEGTPGPGESGVILDEWVAELRLMSYGR